EAVFSETVCLNAAYTNADWVVTVNGNVVGTTAVPRPEGTDLTDVSATSALVYCNGTSAKGLVATTRGGTAATGVTTFSAVELGLASPITQGDFVTVTATCNTATPNLPDTLSPCNQTAP